jgi:formate/nitrite transporter FocA (FNT family)
MAAHKETGQTGAAKGRPPGEITEREVENIEELSSPRTPVIYEIVRRLGEEEMARPAISLWWSGVAAGLSISFSLLAQSILQAHLPDEPWRPLVSSFGYSVGFIMVVLSRQQLFTENTITMVLPLMADFTLEKLFKLCGMWSLVLLANLAGTLFATLFCHLTPVLTPELRDTMLEISRELANHTWLEMATRGIAAGFLIAAMVWLIPGADSAQFQVITMMTYLISVGWLYAYHCWKHGGFHALAAWRYQSVEHAGKLFRSGPHRKCYRRHGSVCITCVRTGDERNLKS